MAIFMTVREEYEDALWRGKDVVACLPESVILLFAFFSQHDGAVIDVLAGDMYLVTGNCCTYTLKEEKKLQVLVAAYMHRFFTALRTLSAQNCGGGNGKRVC